MDNSTLTPEEINFPSTPNTPEQMHGLILFVVGCALFPILIIMIIYCVLRSSPSVKDDDKIKILQDTYNTHQLSNNAMLSIRRTNDV